MKTAEAMAIRTNKRTAIFWASLQAQSLRSKSGSLAILAAMRLASSFVSNAADRRPGSFSK